MSDQTDQTHDVALVVALGHFAASVEPNQDIIERAKQRVLDLVGVALAARHDPAVAAVNELVNEWGGTAQASVWSASGQRVPAASAALVNGTMAHALDFDDTHLPSILHPSASVVPAALAAGESVGASGAEVLAAAAVGTEVCVRVGMASYDPAARNHILFDRGLHATSICGALGAAAAAARLMGLGASQISDAMGIAARMGAGLIEANRTGGSVKRVHCGWAAHSGIAAASLARHGMTGPPTVLEGRFGFFRALSDGRFDPAAVTEGLGSRWESDRIFVKPYPTNHFTHAGIDAARALVAQGVEPSTITAMELGLPAPVLPSIAEPAAKKASPDTGYAAKFSGPATVAAALVGGGGGSGRSRQRLHRCCCARRRAHPAHEVG